VNRIIGGLNRRNRQQVVMSHPRIISARRRRG
jgi:hypothetical protein